MDQELENWMANLPEQLKIIPIKFLAIPGSHDSTTYGISRKSALAPDAEPIVKALKFLGPVMKIITANWAKTQAVDITQQLKHGIRYFDFRIATKKGSDNMYFVHGLYSVEVSLTLEQINAFLDNHPNEVVILDFQHFYAFQQPDHDRLMSLITSMYGPKLLPFTDSMDKLSLQYLTEKSYQVIAVYRSDAARFGQPLLWPSNCFPTPWADTVSIPNLFEFLNEMLCKRNNSYGFISQCVLTPSGFFVFKHLFSSLRTECFLPLEDAKCAWLKQKKPGFGGVNIIISDFVDYQNGNFAKEIIKLNKKLLHFNADNTISSITPVDNSI